MSLCILGNYDDQNKLCTLQYCVNIQDNITVKDDTTVIAVNLQHNAATEVGKSDGYLSLMTPQVQLHH